VPTAPASTQPAAPTADAPLNITQADLDRIITERLDKQKKQFAAAFGGEDPKDVDPVKALETEQGKTKTALDLALSATAESIALAAGIKADRVETFVAIAQHSGLLKDVDLSDPKAKAKLRTALETKAGEYPEWKGNTLPSASGGDRQTPGQPTLDERIAAAQKNGDLRLALALKREKAFQQPR
jgi:hypothetical protein